MTAHDPGGSAPRRTEPSQRLALLAAAVTVALAGTAVVADRRDEPAAARPAVARPAATRPASRPSVRPSVRPTPAPRPAGLAVEGTVVDTRGRPVRGATVRLTKPTSFGDSMAALLTLGMVCVSDRTVCDPPTGSGVTDARGRYTVYVTSGFTEYDLAITSGTTTMSAEVDLATTRLPLPRAMLWSPAPTVQVSGTTGRIGYHTAPRRLGRVRGYHAYLLDPRTRETLRSWRDLEGGVTFDARVMHERPVRFEVGASVRTAFGDTWYAGIVDTRGRQRPDSHRLPCVEYAGKRVVRSPGSCRLVTDGSFERTWEPDYALCPRGLGCEQHVGIDLGRVRTVRFVSAPGCDSVEVSLDGRTWTEVADDWSGCAAAVSVRARYVRASVSLGDELAEIGVWW